MYNFGYEEDSPLNLRDTVKGVVKGQNYQGGLYIDLTVESADESDEVTAVPAFGYWCGRVRPGTGVLCSIKRWAKENRDIFVNVDSVEYGNDEMAASMMSFRVSKM